MRQKGHHANMAYNCIIQHAAESYGGVAAERSLRVEDKGPRSGLRERLLAGGNQSGWYGLMASTET
jgi:hypothetical protein